MNWEKSSWIFSKHIKEFNDAIGPCKNENLDVDVYFPKTSGTFYDAYLNCQTIGGAIPLPENKSRAAMQVELVRKNMENPFEWSMMWIPLKKDYNDISKLYYYTGAWKYYLDKLAPDWLEWQPGQPNGEIVESCVGITTSDDTPLYYDTECSYSFQHLCRVKKVTLFQILGLCENLEKTIDAKYFVNFEENINNVYKDMVWTGYSKSKIEFDKRIQRWKIFSVKNDSTVLSATNQVT